MDYVNVLIKDGNRTISWEHALDESIGYVLDSHELKPKKDTVKVNLVDCKDLYNTRLQDCCKVVYKGIERVVITLESRKEKEVKK